MGLAYAALPYFCYYEAHRIHFRGMLLQPKSGTVDLSEFQDFNDNLIRGVPLDDPAEHFDARHYARYTLEWKFDKVESVLRQAFMGRHIANTQASNPAG